MVIPDRGITLSLVNIQHTKKLSYVSRIHLPVPGSGVSRIQRFPFKQLTMKVTPNQLKVLRLVEIHEQSGTPCNILCKGIGHIRPLERKNLLDLSDKHNYKLTFLGKRVITENYNV